MENNNINITLTDEQISNTLSQIEAVGKELQNVKKITKNYNRGRKEFTEHLLNAFKESYKGSEYERMQKIVKGIYNLIIKAKNNPDKTEFDSFIPGYLRKTTETFIILFCIFRYLGYKEIDDILKEYNIEINSKPLGELVPYMDGLEDTLKMFIKDGMNYKKETEEIKDKIENDIYTRIPNELQNDYGISKGTFKKLYMLNFIKETNADTAGKKYDYMREEINKHTQSDSVTTIIADNVMEEVKKND